MTENSLYDLIKTHKPYMVKIVSKIFTPYKTFKDSYKSA